MWGSSLQVGESGKPRLGITGVSGCGGGIGPWDSVGCGLGTVFASMDHRGRLLGCVKG